MNFGGKCVNVTIHPNARPHAFDQTLFMYKLWKQPSILKHPDSLHHKTVKENSILLYSVLRGEGKGCNVLYVIEKGE